jgi:hypothetical protein
LNWIYNLKFFQVKTPYSKNNIGWGQGGEMTQALYAHMNNKIIKKNNLKH